MLTQDEYIERKGEDCPYCGAKEARFWGDVCYRDGDKSLVPCECIVCSATWNEYLKITITGFGDVDEPQSVKDAKKKKE